MTVKEEGCEIFNNLAEDEDLFKSEGDYQFDVYRYVIHDGAGEGLEIRGIFYEQKKRGKQCNFFIPRTLTP